MNHKEKENIKKFFLSVGNKKLLSCGLYKILGLTQVEDVWKEFKTTYPGVHGSGGKFKKNPLWMDSSTNTQYIKNAEEAIKLFWTGPPVLDTGRPLPHWQLMCDKYMDRAEQQTMSMVFVEFDDVAAAILLRECVDVDINVRRQNSQMYNRDQELISSSKSWCIMHRNLLIQRIIPMVQWAMNRDHPSVHARWNWKCNHHIPHTPMAHNSPAKITLPSLVSLFKKDFR